MALTPSRSGRFKKDYKLMKRRGKDVSKILHVMKTLADAILDRLVHNAHKIKMRGESMRKRKAGTKESLTETDQ